MRIDQFDPTEQALIERNAQILTLSTSSASLDRSPKKNWVENSGNLPPYVRKLARAIERTGKPLSSAIAIAIGRIKRWSAGGDDVTAKTRAKSAKALAQWEALKAKAGGKKVSLTMSSVAISDLSPVQEALIERAWNDLPNAQNGSILEFTPEHVLVNQTDPLDGSTALYTVPYIYAEGFVSFEDPVVVEDYDFDDDDDDVTEEEIAMLSYMLGNEE